MLAFLLTCISFGIFIYFLNKKFHLLAICWRVKTLNGQKLNECFGTVKGVTIFGNNFDMINLTTEKIFENCRNYAEIHKRNYFQFFINSPVFNVITPEYAELVLNNPKLLTKGDTYILLEPFLGTGLLTSGDKKWHFRRKLLTPAFHFNILQRFLETFKDEAVKFLDDLIKPNENNQIISLNEIIPKFTLNNICETALGVNLDDINKSTEYRNNIHNFEELYLNRVCHPLQYFNWFYKLYENSKKSAAKINELHKFSSEIIENRRKLFKNIDQSEGSDDDDDDESSYFKKERHAMLDTLLAAEKQSLINHDGICEEVNTFMFEGFDTTSNGIMFTILMLAIHEDIQEKCFNEISEFSKDLSSINIHDCNEFKYLECVIKETLRLYPPVPFISRKCDTEMIIGNLILPTGTNINLHIFDIHRDPKHFPNPERFDPNRFLPENSTDRHPFAYIPFSAGQRNCIGQKFALMEMKILLTNIIKNYQIFPITKVQDIVFESGMVLRSKYPLEIKIKSRN